MTSGREPLALALLRCGSVRFSAFYFTPGYAALHATGHGGPTWLVAAALIATVGCLAIEWLNRLTDEAEDRVNNPVRTRSCLRVGYEALRRWTAAAFAAFGALALAIFSASEQKVQLAVLLGLAFLVAYHYSAGIRLKRHRALALVALGFPFLLPFVLGWGANRPISEIPIAVLFFPLYLSSMSGAKDLTDETGDRLVGYRSAFLALLRSPRRAALVCLLLLPHALLVTLVVAGSVEPRLLALLVLAPLSVLYVRACRRAKDVAAKRAVRELLYHLLLLPQFAGLLLLFPSAHLAWVFGGVLAYWLFASRFLHWYPGLSRPWLHALRGAGEPVAHELPSGGGR
ncbi:MAG TPA: UbiA family prenyltransferase [Planctomycetota bacterium]|nr:UbiA family prenyltransferase [Planctomycetota bacterium]